MKVQFELEYTLNCSTKVLFPRLSTPEGLAEWFADDVNSNGDIFSFEWNKINTKARLVNLKENKSAKFEWLSKDTQKPNNYFEFRINIEELTGDLALIITDFAEPDEKEDAIYLWDTQVQKLKSVLGS
ncbi:MAG: SRPBCC domain-containing protein [Bacteroidales bacterium]|nr:SRPBCC domain-containing protein [Bacteroidales bacterium]